MEAPPRRFDCQLTTRHGAAAAAPLRVLELTTREELSACFTIDVDVALPNHDAHDLADALLGERVTVSFAHSAGVAHELHGLVARVEPRTAEGGGRERHSLRARIVPRLWLLGRGAQYRIFQAVSVVDVARELLDAAQVPHRFELQEAYEAYEYVVQYDESDLKFLKRLLAREGLHFSFDHVEDGEIVVVSDRASALGDVARGPELAWRADGGLGGTDDGVHVFRVARRVRDGASAVSAFDYKRPLHPQRADASADRGARDARGLRRRHLGTRNPVRVDPQRARLRLDQDRAEARVGQGESRHLGLLPGVRFELTGGPIPAEDGVYHVVRVERSFSRHGAVSYASRFTAVPDGVVWRPPAPARRVVQTVETAIVVGPPGQEIHVDELGRVKVRFHWDESGSPDDRASCWMRTSQTWAGAGWGFQFIPRVGMEVLVAFLGGDVDAPVVIGAVNNLVNPPTHPLPASKTRSGIRTRSSRNGDGYNEIAFEDRKGFEVLSMHAQRNLDVTVLNDAVQRVGGSKTERVQGARFSVVEGNAITSVSGNEVHHVAGDATRTVVGNHAMTTQGGLTERVVGPEESTVEGDRTGHVLGRSQTFVDGAANAAVKGDASVRAEGSLTVVVGRHDAPRALQIHVEGVSGSHSSGATQITADEGITLQCGDSVISLTPDAIQIRSKKLLLGAEGAWFSLGEDKAKLHADAKIVATADEKVLVDGGGATVSLAGEMKLDGSAIKLKAPDSESLTAPDEEGEVTTISLVDREGNPLANQRYRIVLDDGTERVGALDADGRARVRIPSGGAVHFPGVTGVEEA